MQEMPQQGTLDDDDDEAPLAVPSLPAKPKKPDWGSFLQEEDNRQQDELQDEYQQMLNMNDPDQVDKAMKAAWKRMQQEDKQFTKQMVHTHRQALPTPVERSPPTDLAQRSDRMFAAFGNSRIADEALHPRPKPKHRRRLMLNQAKVTLHRQEGGPVLARPPPTEQRAASPPSVDLASLPSGAALEAEAASAEDADFF